MLSTVARRIFQAYNLASTSLLFAAYDPDPMPLYAWAKTTGSSVDIDALSAGRAPFQGLAAEDLLTVYRPDGCDLAKLASVTDADNAAVTAAVNWENGGNGYPLHLQKWRSGTGATDGWFYVGDATKVVVSIDLATLNGTSITVTIQARTLDGAAETIWTKTYSLAEVDQVTFGALDLGFHEMRVGALITGDSGTQSLSIKVEKQVLG